MSILFRISGELEAALRGLGTHRSDKTREMKDAARTLEFEKAAYLRDEIKKLREG